MNATNFLGNAATRTKVRTTQTLMQSALWMHWQSTSAATQRIIKWGVLLLVLSLIWAYVWLPASRGREALSARIPALQAQLTSMKRDADEVKRLNAMPAVVATATPRSIVDTAALQTVFGPTAKISIDDNRQFQVSIPSVAYTNWLDNLESVLTRYRVRVVSVNLKLLKLTSASSMPTNTGFVGVELRLADDSGRNGK